MVHTTAHSYQRAKERTNTKSLKKVQRQINMALERGKRAEDFTTSWERNYLQGQSGDGAYAIAFNQYCYIFSESGVCITMYRLPTWFGKKKNCDGKERIRDVKRYDRAGPDDKDAAYVI